MESRTTKVRRGILWGLLCKCIRIITPFITRTLIIYRLGIEYAGLSSLFTSLLTLLSFAELGIGSAMVFSMYEPIAENDTDKVNALLAFYRKSYLVIGTILLIIGLCLMPFLPRLISDEIPADINLYRLFGIYLFNTVIGYFLFSYRISLFTADQRLDIINIVELGVNMAACVVQSGILLFTKSYYLYAITIPAITCTNNLIEYILSKKRYPQYHCAGKLAKDEMHAIRKKVGGLVCYKIGDIVLSAVDAVVISAFLGIRTLGIYNGYYYVITALFGITAVIHTVMVPSVGHSALDHDNETLYQNFRKFNFLHIWLIIWMSACLLCLYQSFIRLWQGEANMFSQDIVFLFVLYFYIYKAGDMCGMHREALGMWWEGKLIPLIAAIINLMLNIYLVQRIGLPGIVISTIVAIAFVYIPYGGWVLFHGYFHSVSKFFAYVRFQIFYLVLMCVVSGSTWWICQFVQVSGVWELLCKGLICLVVPNLLLLILNYRNPVFVSAAIFLKDSVLRKGT